MQHVIGVATLYRKRGIAGLLIQGVIDPLFIGQMQSVSTYLFGLPRVDPDELATSQAPCFWDAVSAQYWDAATQISTLSRMTHNPDREHEDDFLYVAFLMQRYFLLPSPEDREAHEQAQQQRLDRWEEVLEGGLDQRLDLCRALVGGDARAFEDAIVAISDQRDDALRARHTKEALDSRDMAWLQPIWPEGLALLRLAERDGLVDSGLVVPRVPSVIVVDNPFVYNPNAWRSPDFRPARRPNFP